MGLLQMVLQTKQSEFGGNWQQLGAVGQLDNCAIHKPRIELSLLGIPL
jgi:hypothetical protein